VSLYLVHLQIKKSYSMLSRFICLYHMMLLMALWWSNVFYLNRYTLSLKMRNRGDKNLTFIMKVKWFLHINRWAQIAKFISYLFLNIALSYNVLVTKLWFELHTILHWIIMSNQKQFKICHVLRGSQLHSLFSWD
jgi:hypothetical protein